MITDRAVDARLELPVEQFDENRVVSLHERVPELSSDYSIRPTIAVFHLNVRLLTDRIEVFMHRLEQYRQHLLAIVLREALELNCLSGNPIFDVPLSHVPRLTHPQVLKQLSKRHGEATSRPQRIFLVDVTHVDFKQEELYKWLSICQALQHRVHEACVTKVLQARETDANFRVFIVKELI